MYEQTLIVAERVLEDHKLNIEQQEFVDFITSKCAKLCKVLAIVQSGRVCVVKTKTRFQGTQALLCYRSADRAKVRILWHVAYCNLLQQAIIAYCDLLQQVTIAYCDLPQQATNNIAYYKVAYCDLLQQAIIAYCDLLWQAIVAYCDLQWQATKNIAYYKVAYCDLLQQATLAVAY